MKSPLSTEMVTSKKRVTRFFWPGQRGRKNHRLAIERAKKGHQIFKNSSLPKKSPGAATEFTYQN